MPILQLHACSSRIQVAAQFFACSAACVRCQNSRADAHLVIPLPGLWVDGLAHGAKNAQRLPRVLRHVLIPERLQRPDGCRRCVRQCDLQPDNSQQPASLHCTSGCASNLPAGLDEHACRTTAGHRKGQAAAHLILVDDVPGTPCVWVGGHSLKQHLGRSIDHRPCSKC